MPSRPNLAQRAGRWSAEHRRVAIFGWLALVVACIFIGGAVGTPIASDAKRKCRRRGLGSNCRKAPYGRLG
jgi:hypothetical protein